MTTSELFQRHFGDSVAVDLKHPNTESFFNELSDRCKEEDRIKAMAIQTIPAIEADEGEG